MAELTPTKSISRPSVSPKCKASVCFICLENVDNPHYRRKLFLKSEKTQACINLQVIIGAQITEESCITEIVCINCDRRNSTLVKNILEVRDLFYSSKSKLASQRGCITSIKRQSKENTEPEGRICTKRVAVAKGLFGEQPIASTILSTEKYTQTSHWPNDGDISAVHVSIIHVYLT